MVRNPVEAILQPLAEGPFAWMGNAVALSSEAQYQNLHNR